MLNIDTPLPDVVFAMLPGEDAVLRHDVTVDGSRWQEQLEVRNLPPLQGALAKPGHTKVSRRDVFDLGSREATPHNAFQLLYYSLAWGLGKRAPHLHQRLDSLAANQDSAADLLVTAWTSVRDGGQPEDVYSILTTNRGAGRIPWFGPAFSSKFLYFAQGADVPPRPLILDQVVAGSLGDAWPGAPTTAWFPQTYGRYCTLAGRWAEEASERLEGARKVRADEIELTLFLRR